MPCSLQFQTNSQPVRTWLHGKLPCMQQHILDSYFMFCWWKLIEISRVLNAFNVNMIEKIRHRSDSETLGPRALIVLQVPLMHVDEYIDSLRSLWISFGVLFEPGVMQNEWPVLLSPLGQDYLHISILNNTFDFWRLVSSCQFDIFDVLSQMALRSRCFPTRNRWIDYLKDLGGITSFPDAPWRSWRICHGNNNLADVPKQRLDSTPQLWRVKSCVFFPENLPSMGKYAGNPSEVKGKMWVLGGYLVAVAP